MCLWDGENTQPNGHLHFKTNQRSGTLIPVRRQYPLHSVPVLTLSGVAGSSPDPRLPYRGLLVPDPNQNIRIYDAEDSPPPLAGLGSSKRKDRTARRISQSVPWNKEFEKQVTGAGNPSK